MKVCLFLLPLALMCVSAIIHHRRGYRQDEENALDAVAAAITNSSRYSHPILPHTADTLNVTVTEVTPRATILAVGDVTMDNEFPIDLYLTQTWKEPLLISTLPLNVSKVRIRGDLADKLWRPDTIIRNSKESKPPDAHERDHDSVVVVKQGGNLEYTIRLNAICFCQVDLKAYPFDQQNCKVSFESLKYENFEMVYVKPIAALAPEATLPAHFTFKLMTDVIDQCGPSVLHYNGGGRYSTFCIKLQFKRNCLPAILGSYLPAIILVVSSWTGFFLDHKYVPARISLSTTIILAMVTLGLSMTTPGARHMKHVTASDIYQLWCFAFTFACLIEFGLVHYSTSRAKKNNKRKAVNCKTLLANNLKNLTCWKRKGSVARSLPRSRPLSRESTRYNLMEEENSCVPGSLDTYDTSRESTAILQMETISGDCVADHSVFDERVKSQEEILLNLTPSNSCCNCDSKSESDYSPHRIDALSRILFPVLFVLFNMVYWAVCMAMK